MTTPPPSSPPPSSPPPSPPSPSSRPLRVLVAEDHASVRAGLVLILRGAPGIEVAGEAADGEEALARARALRPDVVLMDVQMPRVDGVAATRAIVAEGLADVLVLTTFDLDAYVFGALRAGAAGFLLKTVEAAELVAAVRTVAAGDGVVDPGVTRRLLAAFARGGTEPGREPPEGLARLTPREREVLSCLGEGLGNAEIAERIAVAEGTVKSHVSRLLAKLGLRNRLQASLLARDLGL
ncbi:response regulator [Streptomyces sp. P6-2-1]|uniref:response regulator n=1 Tax=Streptomyces sp. P6-2-1 TaxID=3422591 RepID=UPI003D35FAD7